MSKPAVRHFQDREHYFNGHEGEWTVCGLPWEGEPQGVVTDCGECSRLVRERRIAR